MILILDICFSLYYFFYSVLFIKNQKRIATISSELCFTTEKNHISEEGDSHLRNSSSRPLHNVRKISFLNGDTVLETSLEFI
jgi:hypothetical protein